MKVEKIDIYVLKIPHHYKVGGAAHTPGRLPGTDYYLEPQWVHAYSSRTESCLVKITADDGTSGWGEVQAPLTPETPAALIATLLGPAILGQNPLATSFLYDRLYHLMLARGHVGSFLIDALAGIDSALWDLKARKYGVPLFELLGGPFKLKLPAYVSGLRFKTLDEKMTAAKKVTDMGFAGVKIFTGITGEALETEVREVRSAIGGDAFFGFDAICRHDLATAVRTGRVLDEVNASYFEAPLSSEDIGGHAALARQIATPVAVGETLRSSRQFEPWLKQRALAIAQPDIMRCGITGTLKIAALCDAHHVPTTLHTGVCTGVGMAATWQVAAALPGSLPQEHQFDLFDAVSKVLQAPLALDKGHLVVPNRPGIGVEVNEQAVRSLPGAHWIVDEKGYRTMELKN
jgi:L-alanine-DL-glutamate epimerase-like enolase superfamily enzyme